MLRERTAVARSQCLFERCWRAEVSRGLCNTHYQVAKKLIRDGRATWEQFERNGKSARLKRQAEMWFLEGIEN